MVQAARSGRQNIAEGSRASATSSQTELRLVNVARREPRRTATGLRGLSASAASAALGQGLAAGAGGAETGTRGAARVEATDRTDQSDREDPSDVFGAYAPWLNHRDPAIVANTVICLIHQANYLLDQQIGALERDFIHAGGYSERLAAARIAERFRGSDLPVCPTCGKPMALRTARQGKRAGSQFWGRTGYPGCKGTRPVDEGNDRTDRTDRSDGV